VLQLCCVCVLGIFVCPMASAACQLRLDIVEGSNTLKLSGTGYNLSTPTRPSITLKNVNETVGLAGAMYLELPNITQCPTTAQSWTSAVALGAVLRSSPSPSLVDQLSLFPSTVQAAAASSSFELLDLGIGITASSGVAISAAPLTLNFSMSAKVASGYSYVAAPGAVPTQFTSSTYTNSTLASIYFQVGSGLDHSCPAACCKPAL
jgi:hypothetical protein